MSQKLEESEQNPVHLLSDWLKIAGIAVVVFIVSSQYLPEIDDEIRSRVKSSPSSWHSRSYNTKEVIDPERGLRTDNTSMQ